MKGGGGPGNREMEKEEGGAGEQLESFLSEPSVR